jgi:N-acetylglucosamine-6-sulfatase
MDGKSVLPWLLNSTVPVAQDKPRTAYLIEFSGLSDWPKSLHERINDCPNNTYRALRVVDPSAQRANERNMLYAELTTVSDYHYNAINWRELYDLDRDPYQLGNLHFKSDAALAERLAGNLAKQWRCKGKSCM